MGGAHADELREVLAETFRQWGRDRVPLLAAALSFYTLLSLAPLILVSITVAAAIFGEEAARGQVYGEIQRTIGPEAAEAVAQLVQGARTAHIESLSAAIGIGAMILGASAVFAQLHSALNAIWGVHHVHEAETRRQAWLLAAWAWIRRRILSFVLVFGAGVLLILSLVASSTIRAAVDFVESITPLQIAAVQISDILVSLILTTVLFAAIFKFVPDAVVRWRDVWMGAVVTSVLFNFGKYAISYYLAASAIGSIFGAAGSLVAILIWVYYACQIVFFGAELTQVLSDRNRARAAQKAVSSVERG